MKDRSKTGLPEWYQYHLPHYFHLLLHLHLPGLFQPEPGRWSPDKVRSLRSKFDERLSICTSTAAPGGAVLPEAASAYPSHAEGEPAYRRISSGPSL